MEEWKWEIVKKWAPFCVGYSPDYYKILEGVINETERWMVKQGYYAAVPYMEPREDHESTLWRSNCTDK